MPVITLLPNAPHQTMRDNHPNSTIPIDQNKVNTIDLPNQKQEGNR